LWKPSPLPATRSRPSFFPKPSSAEAKLERAREAGGDVTINYTSEEREKIVLQRTDGKSALTVVPGRSILSM